jgi:alpha-beta hydrolase superfamily lysophospholipase
MSQVLVSFLTPHKIPLNGVWLGTQKAETVFVFLHGLGGSLFSRSTLLESLAAQKNTAVLTFNNRGFGLINSFKKQKASGEKEYYLAGMAHERFSECLDDIDGALAYARLRGAKNIFLIGHSTGCQKIIYYLAKKKRVKVQGAILLAPVSDYATIDQKDASYQRALRAAKRLVSQRDAQALLPSKLWRHPISAQRFLSLYTPESEEEIFSYASKKRNSLLSKVKIPVLALFATEDEYNYYPLDVIRNWFERTATTKKFLFYLIPHADHSFKDQIKPVASIIKAWRQKYRL